ncbi:uncharacterized protein ISCGN_027839 [Ixodes scapularis]
MSEQAPLLAPGTSEGGTPGPSHASAQQPTQNAVAMSPVVMATSTVRIPTKRRCPDFDKDPLSDDDQTSTYTVHGTVAPSEGGSQDHMQDVDLDDYENPFTEVRYKKNRPAGIPVVFKTVNREKSFWRINPNVVANEVIGIAKEKLLSHRINKDGSLAVSVESLLAANRLLAVTSLCTIEVTPSAPESYSRNLGKIKGVPLEYSDGELLEYLKDFGVLYVQRQIAYRRQDDGKVEEHKTESVILRFRPDRPMPQRILMGFTSHPVEEYFGPPIQCFHCQRYGHISKFCRGPQRCKVCTGPHNHKACTSLQDPKCANCEGPHPSTFAGCPCKKSATNIHKKELVNGRDYRAKKPNPNSDIVRFSRPPPSANLKKSTKRTYSDVVQGAPKEDRSRSKAMLQQDIPLSRNTSDPTTRPPVAAPRRGKNNESNPPAAAIPGRIPQEQQNDLGQVIVPMLFAALRAIIRTLPGSSDLPEVRAILAMEPLIRSTCPLVSGNLHG